MQDGSGDLAAFRVLGIRRSNLVDKRLRGSANPSTHCQQGRAHRRQTAGASTPKQKRDMAFYMIGSVHLLPPFAKIGLWSWKIS